MATLIEADYEFFYLAHVAMESMNCLVPLGDDRCDIWQGEQFQGLDRPAVAKLLGIAPEKVSLMQLYAGDSFGRRANPHSDFVLDADGKLIAWHQCLVGQSIMAGTVMEPFMVKDGVDATSVEGATNLAYDVPNFQVELHTPTDIDVPIQWWRSVGHTHTAFSTESLIDEAAVAAEQVPVAFRRTLLSQHPRHQGVLELAAKKAGCSTAGAGHGQRDLRRHRHAPVQAALRQ